MAPQGQRPKASQVAGIPSIDDGELIPVFAVNSSRYDAGVRRRPGGAPRLRDITTPTEEADLAPGRGPRSKWGAFGDDAQGDSLRSFDRTGAISGAMYGASGQGRRDADKMDRMERIGEITRQRGEVDAQEDRQWKQDLQNAEIIFVRHRRRMSARRRGSITTRSGREASADSRRRSADADDLRPEQCGNPPASESGYAGPKGETPRCSGRRRPMGGSIQVERGEDGKWIPSQGRMAIRSASLSRVRIADRPQPNSGRDPRSGRKVQRDRSDRRRFANSPNTKRFRTSIRALASAARTTTRSSGR